MPHKVPGFFNPHTILPAYFHEPKKSFEGPRLGERTPSISSTSSHDSSDETSQMRDLRKRLSLHGLHLKSSSSKGHHDQHVPPKLSITMESPPIVYYGTPNSSSGALLSGLLKLNIAEASMEIADLHMRFVLETTRKKPFHGNCSACSKQSEEFTRWNFLQGPTKVEKGEHSFPFSHLLKGDLPASIDGSLLKIQYNLHAEITTKQGEKITLSQTLVVKRSILASDIPKQSLRIFPPTNLTAHVDLPPVIYPIGEYTAKLRLDGVISRAEESKVQHQWSLKRMTWRLEETAKMISPACEKHEKKARAKRGANAKIAHANTDVRTIGSGEVLRGWKGDYNTPAGSVELEFPFSIYPSAKPICDMLHEERQLQVNHQLIVELIVAEELAPNKKPSQSTPTGAARILRMMFNMIVTERPGLGISWDEEAPPTYEDVPASPPGYHWGDIYDYIGSPLAGGSSLPPLPEYEPLPE